MRRRLTILTLSAVATLAACSESPTDVSDEPALTAELVMTQGAPAPVPTGRPLRPSLSQVASATANLGGSSTTPLSLTPQSCSQTPSQQVVTTYTVTGRQVNPASFKVNTEWEYDGTNWSESAPTTVNVAARAATDPASTYQVTITVTNASTTGTGTSSLAIVPFALSTTAPAALAIGTAGNVTVHVAFGPCAVTNTAPTLTLPNDMTVEAISSSGAPATFVVTATDAQDGDLTGSVSCSPASGDTFPLGATPVTCSVTDAGGLTTTGTFTVTVVDTTPAHFTSFPSATVQLVAADINGAVLDLGALDITAEDVGNVSEPSTVSCDYVAGTVLRIGTTTTVQCTATDAVGNESAPSAFEVFVGLNVPAPGFLPPLRMAAPYSAHKRGSTIPHKLLPPTYADGTPAIDLAAGLRLVVQQVSSSPAADGVEANDYTAGTTTWRYDDGQYVFNLKTGTASPWNEGTWVTTVSYKGIVLATTRFDLRR